MSIPRIGRTSGGTISLQEVFRTVARPKDQRPTVRLTESGKWWRIRYAIYENGKRLEKSKLWPATGPRKVTKTEAQREANQLAAHLNTPGVHTTARMKFSELAEMWWKVQESKDLTRSTRDVYRSQLNHRILPAFGEMELSAVTRQAVDLWAASTGMAQKTAHGALLLLRAIWNWAIDVDLWAGRNPTDRVKASGKRRERPGIVSVDGWKALADALEKDHPDTSLVCRICASTGCRIGEALGLKWAKIDLIAGAVRIDAKVDQKGRYGPTKTRDHRVISIAPLLPRLTMLERLGEWVFADRGYNLHWRRLKSAAADLGINCERLGFHTARRIMATELDAAGVPSRAIQRVGGWHGEDMIRIYSRATSSKVEEKALNDMQERIQ